MDAHRIVNKNQPLPGWGLAGLSVAVLLLLLLWMYRDTVLHVTSFWNRWDSGESYAHGYLVLAICFYLIFRQRRALARLTPCANAAALVAVIASALLWLAAAVTGVLMVQVIALLLLFLSVIWTALGSQVARRLLFPVLILVFAIPIWAPLPPILQEVTADAAYRIARLISIPLFRQEQLLILPAGKFIVEESCSGVSYLLAALTLGMLYAYLNYQAIWARFLVVVIAGGAAILANILRVVIVVQQGYVTDMQTPLVDEHFNLGWFLFGGMVLVLLLVDHAINRYAGGVRAAGRQYAGEAVAAGCVHGYSRQMFVLASTAVLLASGPAIVAWSQNHSAGSEIEELIMPAGTAGWSGPFSTPDNWMPVYHGAVAGRSAYQKDEYELQLYVAFYPNQQQGSELIYYENRISNEDLWKKAHLRERALTVDGQVVLEQELMPASGRRRLVWYWYRVAGFNTTSQYKAKALQLLGLVTGKPQASVVAVAVDIDDIDSARDAMRDFITAMGPTLSMVADGQF